MFVRARSAMRDPRDRCRGGAHDAGVIAVFTGQVSRPTDLALSRRLRSSRTRRQADVCRRDAGACARPYPFRRRAGRDRGRRHWHRHRTRRKPCASNPRNRRARPISSARSRRCAGLSRRGARQHCARLADGDARRSVRLRESRACRAGAPRRHTACAGLDWSRVQALAVRSEKAQRYTLIATTQGVAVVRKLLAEGVFKVPLTTIRVSHL